MNDLIIQGNTIETIQKTFDIIHQKIQEINMQINANNFKFLLSNESECIIALDAAQIENKIIEKYLGQEFTNNADTRSSLSIFSHHSIRRTEEIPQKLK